MPADAATWLIENSGPVIERVMRLGGLGLLVGWYYTQGRSQAKYVKESLRDEYDKKVWGLPLAAGFAALGAYIVVVFVVAMVPYSTGVNHGTLLTFNKGELYYTSSVTEVEARKLGNYLVKEKFFNGRPKIIQLNRSGGTIEVRLVAKKGIEQD